MVVGVRTRRWNPLLVGAVVLVLVGAVVAAAAVGLRVGSPPSASPRPAESWTTVKIVRQTLRVSTTVDGQLGYGTPERVRVRASGTVTWLAPPGQVLRRGQPLLRVDERPVVVMYGTVPMFRDLGLATDSSQRPTTDSAQRPAMPGPPPTAKAVKATSMPAARTQTPTPTPTATVGGRDVRQLEANLAALGYSGFQVDSKFTKATVQAVRRWQADAGLPVTGVVGAGDVVFVAGPIRVAEALVKVGDDAGADVVSVTGLRLSVVAKVAADDSTWTVPGAEVLVTLPDGRDVKGRVESFGGTTSPDDDRSGGDDAQSAANVPVAVSIPDQKALGKVSGGSVSVSRVSRSRPDVLTVPVAALMALAEGGYGLEVATGTTSHFVAVSTGLFADGLVEVSGPQVSEGLTVRLPE